MLRTILQGKDDAQQLMSLACRCPGTCHSLVPRPETVGPDTPPGLTACGRRCSLPHHEADGASPCQCPHHDREARQAFTEEGEERVDASEQQLDNTSAVENMCYPPARDGALSSHDRTLDHNPMDANGALPAQQH